jgi:hypothetical protein
MQSTSTRAATIGSDRLDYSICRILRHTAGDAQKQRARRFQSLLIIVEAKAQRAVNEALPQLLTYLACLHQSRLRRNRTESSVYGVASDGYLTHIFLISAILYGVTLGLISAVVSNMYLKHPRTLRCLPLQYRSAC